VTDTSVSASRLRRAPRLAEIRSAHGSGRERSRDAVWLLSRSQGLEANIWRLPEMVRHSEEKVVEELNGVDAAYLEAPRAGCTVGCPTHENLARAFRPEQQGRKEGKPAGA
jgi:hypothetical protein